MARPLIANLTGLMFGRLRVIGRSGARNRQPLWRCVCECGNECDRLGNGLRRGSVNSCGCLVAENNRALRLTHGMTKTPIYKVWRGMINRCHNPNQPHYERYGGRGIYVCDEWRNSFAQFYADMGDRPQGPTGVRYTIDRKDNDGPYAAWNCRWATYREKTINKRPRRSRSQEPTRINP